LGMARTERQKECLEQLFPTLFPNRGPAFLRVNAMTTGMLSGVSELRRLRETRRRRGGRASTSLHHPGLLALALGLVALPI
jgi:hypothetical protein